MNLKQFLKPSSENLTASGNLAFRGAKRRSNFYYWVKPDWRKIVIFVILFFVFGLLMRFPLDWYLPAGGGVLPSGAIADGVPTFKLFNLFLDLIIWYLFSGLIIWIYDKIKKKV